MSATEILIANEIKELDRKYMKGIERLYKLYRESGSNNQFRIEKPLLKRLAAIYQFIK